MDSFFSASAYGARRHVQYFDVVSLNAVTIVPSVLGDC
jgi:hypothetical protein